MNSIYSFISNNINIIIVIGGIVVLAALVVNYITLLNQHKQIVSMMSWKNTRTMLNKKTHEVEDKSDSEKVTPDTIREFQTEFNHTASWHEALAQLIPLFPLFGILGTVSGLIMQLSANSLDKVFSSLNTALGSTFFGLVFAIVLKFFDTLWPAKTINETEIILEDYDKKLNNAIMLGNIDE